MEINGRLKINSMTGTSVSVVGYDANATITSGGTTITNLNNWSNFGQTGIVVQTATGAWSGRTITGPAAGITVTNGNGVAGNPTLSLNGDLNALENLASTGIAVRTGTNTWAQRTITAGAGITVTNGNGVSGNPTISLPSSAITNLNLWSAGTGTSSVRTGSNTTSSGNFSVSIGRSNIASGEGSFAGGVPDNGGTINTVATQRNSFSFQEAYAQFWGVSAGSYEQKSAILGGRENITLAGTGSNIILGGQYNRISGCSYSSIIGSTTSEIRGSGGVIIGSTSSKITNGSGGVIIGSTSSKITNGSGGVIIGSTSSNITNGSGGVIIGSTSSNITGGIAGAIILGGSSMSATDNNTVYVPNHKITGFRQQTYVTVGASSTTLAKETSVVIGGLSVRGGSITTTLPASPVDGQIIKLRRIGADGFTWTLAPNTGYTLNVNGLVGNYNIGVSTKLTVILIGTVWYDI